MKLFDYYCHRCNDVFEELTNEYSDLRLCPVCHDTCQARLTPPRVKLDGTDISFRTSYDKWDKKRQQKMAQEKKTSYYDGEP